MSGKTLLTTTALVLCVSTAFAGQKVSQPSDRIPLWNNRLGLPLHLDHGIPRQFMIERTYGEAGGKDGVPFDARGATFSNLSDEANARFLTTYGYTLIDTQSCYYHSQSSHYCASEIANNAIPFTGAGKKVAEISVPVFFPSGSEFSVGIYSATASGLPGSEIVGASAVANGSGKGGCCWQLTNVPITPTKLNARQKYFLEVRCPPASTTCMGGWLPEDSDFKHSQHDYWHVEEKETYNFGTGTHTYSVSSPWQLSTAFNPYDEPAAAIK
jgi:hypothetical protein